MKYAAVIEQGPRNHSAHVPDLPGCVSSGRTLSEVTANIRAAIELRLRGLREGGLPIPVPKTILTEIDTSKSPN